MTIFCDFGCGKVAIKQFATSKKWCCSNSTTQCPALREADSRKKKGINPFEGKTHPKGMKGRSAWNKGKTYEEMYGEKAQHYRKLQQSKSAPVLTDAGREKLRISGRESILKRYAEGWEPKAGRCKKIQYHSPIAGTITVDGTWELKMAKFLDKTGIVWQRNKKKFKYRFGGKDRNYTPDFFLPERNIYLEVKGYATAKDRAKWSQFAPNLLIFQKEEMKQLD